MRVLVTGGAGFIGSHCVVELLNRADDVQIVDNYCNSSPGVIEQIGQLAQCIPKSDKVDLLSQKELNEVFASFKPDAVIHFAGLKAVGESTEQPLLYYRQNIQGSLNLLEAMDAHDCVQIIFSSSATVYGEPVYLPLDELHGVSPTNPYGKTKYFIEEIIRDWVTIGNGRKAIALRYFNPVGAHPSGLIGENPQGVPNNLMPYIAQVAIGKMKFLNMFGDDYDTDDGTGVRDYLHVVDLAKAHVCALDAFEAIDAFEIVNLGTGRGHSVLEMVRTFEKASGRSVPYKIRNRRAGDIASCWAKPEKAKTLLKWQAEETLEEMCRSSWAWQQRISNDSREPGKQP